MASGERQVAVGVEALDEFVALVAEIRADGKRLFKFDGDVPRLRGGGLRISASSPPGRDR